MSAHMSESVSVISAHGERERATDAHAHMSAHERELYTPSRDAPIPRA